MWMHSWIYTSACGAARPVHADLWLSPSRTGSKRPLDVCIVAPGAHPTWGMPGHRRPFRRARVDATTAPPCCDGRPERRRRGTRTPSGGVRSGPDRMSKPDVDLEPATSTACPHWVSGALQHRPSTPRHRARNPGAVGGCDADTAASLLAESSELTFSMV